MDEPVMRLALGVLDKLSAGDGSGAVEDYARLFYALRSAGSRSLGSGWTAYSGIGNPLCRSGGAGRGGPRPGGGRPAGY
ncbi:hypothetical protein M5E87_13835 [Flavonifractor plautii]|nr:hypothetical protein M5E87_13835 [Flavonifractor plautii]